MTALQSWVPCSAPEAPQLIRLHKFTSQMANTIVNPMTKSDYLDTLSVYSTAGAVEYTDCTSAEG